MGRHCRHPGDQLSPTYGNQGDSKYCDFSRKIIIFCIKTQFSSRNSNFIQLDAAIVASIEAGFEGRLLLHADPAGGQELFDYYTYFGLKSLDASLPIDILRATNDGRYFYADEKTAAYIVRRNKRYR